MSNRGLQTAASLAEVIRLHQDVFQYQKLELVLNRIDDVNDYPKYALKTGLSVLGVVPEDPLIGQFDREGKSLTGLPSDSGVYRAIPAIWSLIAG